MAEIIHINADGNYCMIHFTEREEMLVSKNIGFYDETLNSFGFMRVHRGHTINLHHVLEYCRYDGGSVIMSDNCKIPVSNVKKDELLEKMNGI